MYKLKYTKEFEKNLKALTVQETGCSKTNVLLQPVFWLIGNLLNKVNR